MNFRYILITACTVLALAACDHGHDHDEGHENDHGHAHHDATGALADGQTQAFYGDEEALVIEDLPEDDHGHGHDHEHDNGHNHQHGDDHNHDHENGHENDHEHDHEHGEGHDGHADREPHAH